MFYLFMIISTLAVFGILFGLWLLIWSFNMSKSKDASLSESYTAEDLA